MRILGVVQEDEVVAAYLRAELGSGRYGEVLRKLLERDGFEQEVLARPDLTDSAANRYRRGLLDEHRGFERRIGLFAGFPDRVDWYRAAFGPHEVLAIRYINWDWWLELSAGTRRPTDAAERIRRGEVPGVTVEEHRMLVEGPQPELIAVTKPDHSSVVLVEGHYRLTAYAMFPGSLPEELELYVGIAEDMDTWSEF